MNIKNTLLAFSFALLTVLSDAFIIKQRGTSQAFTNARTIPVSTKLPTLCALQQSNNVRNDKSFVLYMGSWGPDPEWSSAKIKAVKKACKSGLSLVFTVEVSPEVASQYRIPGQYVQLRRDDSTKPLYLAMASPPDPENATFEFLVKKVPGNEWLTQSSTTEAGVDIQVSQIMGTGFPIAENLDGFKYDFPTQNVLLFAAGSGLAPIKAALESDQLDIQPKSGRTARLYYGERVAADLCFVEKYADWEAAGIEVVPVLSQPTDDCNWKGRTGYVQNALEEDGVAIPRNSGALLCGMKGMHESVKSLLLKAGVFDGRVLFNY